MTAPTLAVVRRIFDYDPASGKFRFKESRGRRAAGSLAGYVKSDGYRMVSVEGRWCYAHRLAWFYAHGEWPEAEIDHVNGDRDDNRIANLRPATRSENMRNVRGAKGWHWHSRAGKWQALIRADGKRKYLGAFATEAEAKAAYEKAAAELHGQFRPAPAKQQALDLAPSNPEAA